MNDTDLTKYNGSILLYHPDLESKEGSDCLVVGVPMRRLGVRKPNMRLIQFLVLSIFLLERVDDCGWNAAG
jgi:hypothetical protein